MPPRTKEQLETVIQGRKADLNPNTTQREISDRVEALVVARIQQRTHFSRQGVGHVAEVAYYG